LLFRDEPVASGVLFREESVGAGVVFREESVGADLSGTMLLKWLWSA
jgi:hypothetical protein